MYDPEDMPPLATPGDLEALAEGLRAEFREVLAGELAPVQAQIAELRALITPPDPEPDPTDLPGWGLPVFRDEFDNGLANWNVRDRNGFGLTFDTAIPAAANATVEDGALHLRGKWLATPEMSGPQGILTHTTGYVDQRALKAGDNHFSQRYGRWEARVKVPTGPDTRGAHIGFWLRCDNHPGEIDILECWGYGGPMSATYDQFVKDSGTTTFHSSTNSATVNGKPYIKTFWRHWEHGVPRPWWGDWHVVAFEYTPDYAATFVDGVEVFRVTPTSPDPVNKGKTLAWLWDPDFFGSPMHLRINQHVGPSPTYWGLPDPANRQWTTEPLDYQVDYVRVWAYDPAK